LAVRVLAGRKDFRCVLDDEVHIMSSKTVVLAVLFLAVVAYSQISRRPAATPAPGRPAEDLGTIIGKLEDQMRLAVLKGTSGWWVENLDEGYSETDSLGKVHTRDEVIAMQRSSDLVYDAWNLSDRTLHTYNGDTVIIIGKVNTEGTYKGQSLSGDFQFTRIWVKRGLEWKLASSQLTRIAATEGKP